MLRTELRVAGISDTSIEDFPFPSGFSTLTHLVFGSLFSYLSTTALDQRL